MQKRALSPDACNAPMHIISDKSVISCALTSHCRSLTFTSYEAYESHYKSTHTYTCSECNRILPSPHTLDMHLSEVHSSYFEVLSTRKPSFVCFVEGCKVMSIDAGERRDHCVKMHSFSEAYPFDCVAGLGLDDAFIGESNLTRVSSHTLKVEDANDVVGDVEMDALDTQFKVMSIPKNISFGRGRGSSVRGIQSRMHYHMQTRSEPKEPREKLIADRVPLKIVKTYKTVSMDESV